MRWSSDRYAFWQLAANNQAYRWWVNKAQVNTAERTTSMNYQWPVKDLKGMLPEELKRDGMLETKIKYYAGNLVSSIKTTINKENFVLL